MFKSPANLSDEFHIFITNITTLLQPGHTLAIEISTQQRFRTPEHGSANRGCFADGVTLLIRRRIASPRLFFSTYVDALQALLPSQWSICSAFREERRDHHHLKPNVTLPRK